jgi:hypothetical protein
MLWTIALVGGAADAGSYPLTLACDHEHAPGYSRGQTLVRAEPFEPTAR